MRPARELIQVGHYLRRDQAEERGLVVLAIEKPYWILEEDGLFSLYVDGHDVDAVTEELEKFEAERAAERAALLEAQAEAEAGKTAPRPGSFSLYAFIWVMLFWFAIQASRGPGWVTHGQADAQAILHGELWRTVTALTLHADLGHLTANIACGLVFAWSLLPLLGSGWTWLGLVLSGLGGNLLNALSHRGGDHLSIGASTAVFGGLGLLVGFQVAVAFQRRKWASFRPRHVFLPFSAGLALLAYLGVGDGTGNVDILAHGFGMLCGLLLGTLLGWTHLPEKTPPPVQKALATAALLIPAIAWGWAFL